MTQRASLIQKLENVKKALKNPKKRRTKNLGEINANKSKFNSN